MFYNSLVFQWAWSSVGSAPANTNYKTYTTVAPLAISTFAVFITPHEEIDGGRGRTTNVTWTGRPQHSFTYQIYTSKDTQIGYVRTMLWICHV